MLAVVSLYGPMDRLYTVQGLVLREREFWLLQSSVVEWRSRGGGAKISDY